MKKQFNQAKLILTFAFLSALSPVLAGQNSGPRRVHSSTLTVATGAPYYASAGYSYTFSDGLSAGISIAKPGKGATFGVFVLGDLALASPVRFFSDAELTYNNSSDNANFGSSWLMISSHLSAEWVFGKVALSLGTGVLGILTVSPFPVPIKVSTPFTVFGQAQTLDMGSSHGSVAFFQFWHSPRVGLTVRLNEKLVLISDFAVAANGFVPATGQWKDGSPIFMKIGIATTF